MKSLAVFMTLGMSLEAWQKTGVLTREIALYEEHAKSGVSTVVVSYGGREDVEIAKRYPFLSVLANEWRLPKALYAALLPTLAARRLGSIDVIKTNQLSGAKQAVETSARVCTPVVVRQGFSLVEHVVSSRGEGSSRARKVQAYERKWLRRADLCQFSSQQIKEGCVHRANVDPQRTITIPNYVVDECWSPAFSHFRALGDADRLRLCTWGRLAHQKNLHNLISACAARDVELVIAGDGALRQSLEEHARDQGARVTFLGQVKHQDISKAIGHCDAFVLASHIEGHPKALIEAMYFGMPVIAADSPGIAPFVSAGHTAIVAKTAVDELAKAIARMQELSLQGRRELADQGQHVAKESYSLAAISRKELDAYRGLVKLATRV